jgi:hypothetical protein
VGDPQELHPADEGNPSGYWEPHELIQIDDALLASWGGHQRNPQVGARPASLDDLPASLAGRMREYAKRWEPRQPFVWKDPRLCITLPLWRPLLPLRGVVIAAREPGAVARSLAARDGMPEAAGLAIWEVYVRSLLAALDEIPRIPRMVVRYEDLVGDGEKVVERLAAFAQETLGIAPPDASAAVRGIERRAVAPAEASGSPRQRELYRLLCEGRPAPEALASPEVVALVDAAAALGGALARQMFIFATAEAKIARLRERLAEADARAGRRGPLARLRRWVWRLRAGRGATPPPTPPR